MRRYRIRAFSLLISLKRKSFDQVFAVAAVGALFVCHWHTAPFSKVCGFQRQILACRLGRCFNACHWQATPFGRSPQRAEFLCLHKRRKVESNIRGMLIRREPSPGVPFYNLPMTLSLFIQLDKCLLHARFSASARTVRAAGRCKHSSRWRR